jgi:monovalent cation:H+ antiporter-2, CPA2 family
MPMDASFFRDLTYVLLAASVGGAAARLARQPVLVGYVLGGILVSPFTPGPVVSELHTFELFAEIGVILLMFFIGGEFSPQELFRLRWVGFVGGTVGVLALTALGFGAVRLLGLPPVTAVVVGMIVSTASTLVLVRLLLDRGELHARHGRVAVGITLVDDLAVVIFILLIPSLGVLEPGRVAAVALALGKSTAILLLFSVLAATVFPRLLARVARTQHRELFLMVTLLLSVGTAAVSQAAGLSLALGAFLAGLLISGSDYVHEALARLQPLRDVFVAVFFVTVGVLIDPRTLLDNVPLVGVMIGLVVVGKLVVWTLLVRVFRETWRTALLVAVSLTQIGEFAFLLARAGMSAAHLDQAVFNATLLTALLTILLNAALVRMVPAWLARLDRVRGTANDDAPQGNGRQGHVILCGFGPLGSAVGEALETFTIPFVVVETDLDTIQGLRARSVPTLFGDAQQEHILEQAGLDRAAALVVTLAEADATYGNVRAARILNHEIPIVARAGSPEEQRRLQAAGATAVIQPRLEGAALLIQETLAGLGLPAARAYAYLERFREAMGLPIRQGPPGPDVLPEVREVPLVASAELADQSLREARVRERFGVLVLAVRRVDGTSLVSPSPDTPLRSGERLRVFGLPAQLAAFEAATGGARGGG